MLKQHVLYWFMFYCADLTAHHKNMRVIDRELGVIICQTAFKTYWTWKLFETTEKNMVQSFSNQHSVSWIGSTISSLTAGLGQNSWKSYKDWGFHSAYHETQLGMAMWFPKPQHGRVEAWTSRWAWPEGDQSWQWNIRSFFCVVHPTEWVLFLPALICGGTELSWLTMRFDAGGMGMVGWQVGFAGAVHVFTQCHASRTDNKTPLQLVVPFSP